MIEGAVTFDGCPCPDGTTSFIPQGAARGPTAGAVIEDGRFTINRDQRTFTGDFLVEIVAA